MPTFQYDADPMAEMAWVIGRTGKPILKATVLTLLKELNTIRTKVGLPEMPLSQLADAIKKEMSA